MNLKSKCINFQSAMWCIKSLNKASNPFKFSENVLEIKSVNSSNLTAALSALSIVPDENFFDRIHHLQLTKCTVIGSDFLELLRQTPNLKELNLIAVKVGKCDGRICNPIKLKLSDLGLEHGNESTEWMFEHLHCTEVSNHLKIRNILTKWKSDSLVMFLTRLRSNVNYLQMIDINLDNLAHPIFAVFNFNWRFLHLDTFGFKPTHSTENNNVLKQLCAMAMEKESCLKIGSVTNKFKDRSVLQILKFCIGSEIELLGEWNQANSVSDKFELIEKLTLRSISKHPTDNTNFIEMFPRVKRLQVEFGTFEKFFEKLNMLSIATHLKEVETLVIDWHGENLSNDNFHSLPEKFRNIKLPKLKTIELGPVRAIAKNDGTDAEILSNLTECDEKMTRIKLSVVSSSANNDLLQSIGYDEKGSRSIKFKLVKLRKIYTDQVSGGRFLGKEHLISEYLSSVERRLIDL